MRDEGIIQLDVFSLQYRRSIQTGMVCAPLSIYVYTCSWIKIVVSLIGDSARVQRDVTHARMCTNISNVISLNKYKYLEIRKCICSQATMRASNMLFSYVINCKHSIECHNGHHAANATNCARYRLCAVRTIYDLVVVPAIMAIALRHNDNHLSLNYTICLFCERWRLQATAAAATCTLYTLCIVFLCNGKVVCDSIYARRYFYSGNGFEVADT